MARRNPMPYNRLQPVDLTDFTGGLNLRRDQFQLAPNESPDMLNVDCDPRGGFYTRKGWQRWNVDDVIDPTANAWQPRNALNHNLANDDQTIYVVNNHVLYAAQNDGVFSVVASVNGQATPHQVDMATWGDYVY